MISIKIQYNGIIRKVNITTTSWLELEVQIRNIHSLSGASRLLLTYLDEDGDSIAIDSDAELSDFIHNYCKNARSPKLLLHAREGDQDSFEIITRNEINGATADDSSIVGATDDISLILPPYSSLLESSTDLVDPFMDVDSAETESIHSTEDKGKAPLHPAANVAQEATNIVIQAIQRERNRIKAQDEAAMKRAEEHDPRAAEKKEEASEETGEQLRQHDAELEAKLKEPAVNQKTKAIDAQQEDNPAYQELLAQIQPLVDQLITKLEANPQYLGRLLAEYNSTLAQRGFGLHFSGDVAGIASGFHHRQGCVRQHTQNSFGNLGLQRSALGEIARKPAVWHDVFCDSCRKSDFEGSRYLCIKCDDYDLCGDCYTHHEKIHDATHTFEQLADPRSRWYGVVCNGCLDQSFPGSRYVCLSCPDFDLCPRCYDKIESVHPMHEFERMSDPDARHFSVSCDACNVKGFIGTRYKCATCPDFDLCFKCFRNGAHHINDHKFRKIEVTISRGEGFETLPVTPPAPSVFKDASASIASASSRIGARPAAKEEQDPLLEGRLERQVEKLISMGFGEDRALFVELLRVHGRLEPVVEILLAR